MLMRHSAMLGAGAVTESVNKDANVWWLRTGIQFKEIEPGDSSLDPIGERDRFVRNSD